MLGGYPFSPLYPPLTLAFSTHHVELGQRVPLLEEIAVEVESLLRHFQSKRAQVALARRRVDSHRYPPFLGSALDVVELPNAESQKVRGHLRVGNGRESIMCKHTLVLLQIGKFAWSDLTFFQGAKKNPRET